MSTNLDLVTNFYRGITQSNPLSEDQDSQLIGLQMDYILNSQTQSQAPDRPSIDQNDLIQNLNKKQSLLQLFKILVSLDILDDLRNDPQFMTVSERFLKSIKDENIFEYLRDSNFSPTAAFARANQAKKWGEGIVQDYNYLRSKFDNAKLGGVRSVAGLIKDSFVDAYLIQ